MPHGNWFRFLIVCSWLMLLGEAWDLGVAFLGWGDLVEDLQRAQWATVWVSVDYAVRWAIACVILIACYRLLAKKAWAAKLLLITLFGIPAMGLISSLIHAGEIARLSREMAGEPGAYTVALVGIFSIALLFWIGVPTLTWYYLSRPQVKQWLAEPVEGDA